MGFSDFFKKRLKPASPEKSHKDQSKEGPSLQDAFQSNLEFIQSEHFSADDIKRLFESCDNQVCFSMGEVDFPTGKVIVADPLVYLYNTEYSQPLNHTIPQGSYQVYISVHDSDVAGLRIVAAKLKITQKDAIRYEIAMPQGTTIEQLNQPGILAGFGVDAGLASFCDARTAVEYREFLDQWSIQNPNGNYYDDYFASFFAQSYDRLPQVQRREGDFI
ncbi:MAG: DUF4241 domain-containing protein, partial [Oscillospiraceae bacterium]|nr:DUF4241 domain-containing protein [Oscillospiraceae bacterium]